MMIKLPRLRWSAGMYRAGPPSEMPADKTAYDVIMYETRNLGNVLYVYADTRILRRIPASRLLWLYPTRAQARSCGGRPITRYHLTNVSITIATDSDGGELVLWEGAPCSH